MKMRTPFYKLKKFIWPYSLKYRLVLVFILNVLVPLMLVGSLSYYSMYSIQKNKVHNGLQSSLEKMHLEFEMYLDSLDYTSKQLAFDGKVGQDMLRWLLTDDMFEKSRIKESIEMQLRLISYTNSDLGLMLYYIPDSEPFIFFETLVVKQSIDFNKIPMIVSDRKVNYYGPYNTFYMYSNNKVFSVIRQLDMNDEKKVFIYIESNYKLLDKLIQDQYFGMDTVILMLNGSGTVTYSNNETDFPAGSSVSDTSEPAFHKSGNSYIILKCGENTAWQLCMAIKREDFNREVFNWAFRYIFLAFLSLCLSLSLAYALWRSIYRPIRKFNDEIEEIASDKSSYTGQIFYGKEFDDLLAMFKRMSGRVKELITTVEEKERVKRRLEVEKLMYQINPHFLHNALDNVRWLARTNGQDTIDDMVSALNKLLHYNLGKQGRFSNVREEIEAVKNYLRVQELRYDFKFKTNICFDVEIADHPLPRFILQPIVENAFHHGLNNGGSIDISIHLQAPGAVIVQIRDDGRGMPEEMIKKLLYSGDSQEDAIGMGIGIRFVRRLIAEYYGSDAQMTIESKTGCYTLVTLILPVIMEGLENNEVEGGSKLDQGFSR